MGRLRENQVRQMRCESERIKLVSNTHIECIDIWLFVFGLEHQVKMGYFCFGCTLLDKSLCNFKQTVKHTKSDKKLFLGLGMKPNYFSLILLNIINTGPAVTVQCPRAMRNLSNFRCRPRSGVGKMWKSKIAITYWINNRASIFMFYRCEISKALVQRLRFSARKAMGNLSNLLCRIRPRKPHWTQTTP